MQYSHSKLACFEQCPLKFKLTYVERPEIEIPKGIEAFLGNVVHDALQMLYDLNTSGRVLDRSELLEHFNNTWQGTLPPDVRIVRQDLGEDDYRRVGLRCLDLYYEHYHPFDQDLTVATEHRLTFPLGESGGHTLVGYIDRLSRTGPGIFEIHDYKTSSRMPTRAAVDRDRQLALYELGLRRTWPEPVAEVSLVWHYLRFDAELRSSRSAEDLARVEGAVVGTVAAIEETLESGSFPPRESALCPWCDFRQLCPLFAHEESTQSLEAEEFRAEDGVSLVDAFAAADSREKEGKAAKQALRERLLKLAEARGYSRIVGTTHQISVSASERSDWPTASNDPGAHAELVDALREAGVWDEVSDIRPSALDELWSDPTILEHLKSRLDQFRRVRTQRSVRLSRRSDV
jgi:putative RecB family exonuclease